MANYKKQTFYATNENKGGFKLTPIQGEIVEVKGIKIGIHKNKKGYFATEVTTGFAVTAGEKTRKETIAKVESLVDKLKKLLEDPKFDKYKEAIKEKMNPAPEVKAVANNETKETPVKADAPEKKVTKKAATKKEEKKEDTMEAAKEVKKVVVEMQVGKVTKNTIRFEEIVESEFVSPKIGTCYIPKGTLGELGYEEGQKIRMEFEAVD